MKKGLDLVLVHPGNRMTIYQSLGSELSAIEPPVWAGMTATFIRNHGFSVAILDTEVEDITPQVAAERIKEMSPRLVAIVVYGHQPSASTQNMAAASAICTAVKQLTPDMKVLLFGGHVASLPERTLREERADFICSGEGPSTVLELLETLKSAHPDYSRVRGLWYWDGQTPRATPAASLVQDLDREMPRIAWDLLPMKKYRAHNWHVFGDLQRQPYGSLYTTLGCPYHCSFCCIQAPFKSGEKELGFKETFNSYRRWGSQAVVAQIDELVTTYGVRNIKFADEMFVLDNRHIVGICDQIIARGYHLNIWAYARIDTVRDPVVLAKMKQAGIHWLAIGIESASDYVRDGVDKSFGKADIRHNFNRVREAGISIIANFIFGLPDDTGETMQETLDMAIDLCPDFANFYSAMAYPGSPLYDIALAEGWRLPATWEGYSQHSVETLPLPTKHVSASEVLRFRDHAFQVFFTHPMYLAYVAKRFGPQTVQHIQEMAAHRLERKYA